MSVLDQKVSLVDRTLGGSEVPREQVLGISFFNGTAREVVQHFKNRGGYLVAPAAPALLKLYHDEEYRRALQEADLAIADSKLLVVVWKIATGRRLRKISGISYLRCFLEQPDCQTGTFWVVASESAKQRAFQWLGNRGFPVEDQDFYVAPHREKVEDYALLLEIEKRQPHDIVIATAAGAQEKLGLYLRDYLHCERRPSIHCIGAALGFLTGDQPSISEWADKHDVGWLPRLLSQPRLLLPRIGIALALVGMILKYRSQLPPLRRRWTEL